MKTRNVRALIFVVVVLAGAGLLSFRVRTRAQQNACLNNLRQLDGGSQSWGAVFRKSRGDEVDVPAVCEYIKGNTLPICPSGGEYTVPSLGLGPSCSVHGPLWEGQNTSVMKFEPGYRKAVQQHAGG